jgi:hypothetical protein
MNVNRTGVRTTAFRILLTNFELTSDEINRYYIDTSLLAPLRHRPEELVQCLRASKYNREYEQIYLPGT